jgi:hypothetical protein
MKWIYLMLLAISSAILCGCQHTTHGHRKLTLTFGSPFSIVVEDQTYLDDTGQANYGATDKVTQDPFINWLFPVPPVIPETTVVEIKEAETIEPSPVLPAAVEDSGDELDATQQSTADPQNTPSGNAEGPEVNPTD